MAAALMFGPLLLSGTPRGAATVPIRQYAANRRILGHTSSTAFVVGCKRLRCGPTKAAAFVDLVVGVAGLAVVFALLSIWLNWKSALFRTIALTALVLLLANPLLRQAERAGLKDIVLILVDNTASHGLDERRALAESADARVAAG